MATQVRTAEVSFTGDRISILNRDAVKVSSSKHIFKTIGSILAPIRGKLIDDKDPAQLSEYCSKVCDALRSVTRGKNADGLNESMRLALEDLERVTHEIERTLRRGVSASRIKHKKRKVEGPEPKVQKRRKTLNALSAPLDETLSSGERSPDSAPVDSHDAATTSVSGSSYVRSAKRAFAPHELPSLIEVIFSSQDDGDTIRRLLGDDAQAFVDVIDEALDRPDISPQTRESCLKLLYRTCCRHALLPTTMNIPVSLERTDGALYRGGFADVWKGEHCGRDIAVKVIRIYSDSNLQRVIGKFCKEVVAWRTLQHPNILPLIGVTMSEARFAMISDWMANGSISSFVKAHPDANQLELLRGVTCGLIYIHSQGMIHGDLKGANILIDQSGCARLADFGLLTIITDPRHLLSSSSHTQGGTIRWMSPERIAPERFGFKNSRPTISSDCYALGMVIYETISGNLPFHKDADYSVSMKIVEGERPFRGARFTESLWEVLELCWASKPNDRPSIEEVLQCLEMISSLPEIPSPGVDDGMEEEEDELEDDDDDELEEYDYSDPPSDTATAGGDVATPPSSSHPVDRPTGTTSDESNHAINTDNFIQRTSGGKTRCIWNDPSGNECGFESSSSLVKRHVRTVHLKIRPVVCSECGQAFATKFHLKIHQNIHTGQKPYSCPDCTKTFSNPSSRHHHRVRYHGYIQSWRQYGDTNEKT